MKKYAAWLLAFCLLCGTAVAEVPEGVPVVSLDVYAKGRAESNIAMWHDAGLDVALHIFEGLGITPRWPGFFPDGFDPEAEPRVDMSIQRDNINYADYRTGVLVSTEPRSGFTREYWALNPSVFDQPTRIELTFTNEAGDSHFTINSNINTVRRLGGAGRGLQNPQVGPLGNGMICSYTSDGEGVFHLWRIYLYEDSVVEAITKGELQKEDLMVAYELRSRTIRLEPLMEIARGLVLREE